MPSIIPIPTTRVSDYFVRQRLLSQIQLDQREIFRLQTSISTGRRLHAPSDDAPAAARIIDMQGLLERKQQLKTNLVTGQSYLDASDSAIQGVSGLLAELRGVALSVADTISSDTQRQAAASQVKRGLEELIDIGNRLFRGRYLFAGSRTTQRPFEQLVTGAIRYNGDDTSLSSYSDLNLLFETNVTGDAVFGAISHAATSTSDLNPTLRADTRLGDLHGGAGVRLGSVKVSLSTVGGVVSSTVDLSSARTIGDVARLLMANPPPGRTITARVTATGLTVEADTAGGGTLTIGEVGSGTTAADLGILNITGVSGPIVGSDLDPRITLTTPLADLLGTRASALVPSVGAANDLIFEAAANGADFNGVSIQFVDDGRLQSAPGLTAGNERVTYSEFATSAVAALRFAGGDNDIVISANAAGTAFNGVTVAVTSTLAAGTPTVAYNAGTKTLSINLRADGSSTGDDVLAAINAEGTFSATLDDSAELGNTGNGTIAPTTNAAFSTTANTGGDAKTLLIYIEPGVTSANQVIAAVNAEGTFNARPDTVESANTGQGTIVDSFTDPQATGLATGGGGIVLDRDSGLRIVTDGQAHDIDFQTESTVEDLLNKLNGAGIGLLAEINASGTALNIRTRLSGTNFSIGENGGTTAADLGVRTLTDQSLLEDLRLGIGIHTAGAGKADFAVVRPDGTEFSVELTGAVTIADVLSAVNSHPQNSANGAHVVARLSRFGNGIELLAEGPPGGTTAVQARVLNFSQAAIDLGLIALGATTSSPPSAGTAAQATVVAAGLHNDLVVRAASDGSLVNDVQVRFVDTGLGAGNSTAVYDSLARTLTFDIDVPTTTANQIVALVASTPGVNQLFTVSLATADGSPNDGTGLVGLSSAVTLTGGTASALTGEDPHPQEVAGVFTALKRLEASLLENDIVEINRSIQLLDDASVALNFARADSGARQQSLDVLHTRLEDEEIELKSTLSVDLDVDLAQAISDFTARQASFEAALRSAAAISQLTLLDYL